MNPRNKKAVIGIALLALAFLALLVWSSMGLKKHRVEVCITFQGKTACRTAAGPTREQAQQAAIDTACALLASGMTETMACGRTSPDSVNWLE